MYKAKLLLIYGGNFMKISNNYYNIQSSINNQKNVSQPSFSNVLNTKNKNCDQIIISTKVKQTNSDSFTESLTNNICEEVRTSASEDRLESLKNEIENGTYKIDIDEIAKRIMLN
ncbi:hypothetical protein SDC9_82644 [bioreactor metagenome]|uniref:Anti-sigma-28 factor FlgM C-terminal domain-containing protein n=1 Tax=bioreactor metagenome TaxID=1076179 RepID=A0A644Z621_9ZZZZ